MFTKLIGITLGLILAFGVTKAVNPHSPVVKAVDHAIAGTTKR
jgi:hypothetical protein